MIMTYEELVQKRQSGEIDDLQFLLAQKELADMFKEDIKKRGDIPTSKNAASWLTEYENKNLYNQDDGSVG
jgi:hypothetical protein